MNLRNSVFTVDSKKVPEDEKKLLDVILYVNQKKVLSYIVHFNLEKCLTIKSTDNELKITKPFV